MKRATLQHQIDQLGVMFRVLSARVSDLEASNAELRAQLDLDPPPPIVGRDVYTAKQVAHRLGLSLSTVHNYANDGRLKSKRDGKKLLITSLEICKVPSKAK